MSIFCVISPGTVDHHLFKTIGKFVYLTVQVNLKCLWDNRDIESIKCGTIGIKGGLGPPWGPQWVQGEALMGAQGAKPPEANGFQAFRMQISDTSGRLS